MISQATGSSAKAEQAGDERQPVYNSPNVNIFAQPSANKYILIGGLLLSIMIKFFLLGHIGNFDMQHYNAWGNNLLHSNLADAYTGIYFPLQWQLLAICSWVGNNFCIFWVIPFKCMNLLFDIAVFTVLVMLLNKFKLNSLYALYYCLHPWFLLNFSQGFIDSQFAFFVLLPLLILRMRNNTWSNYLFAGIPLACAFLMKPQVMLIVASVILFAAWSYYNTKDRKILALLVPVISLFLIYNAYFTLWGTGNYVKKWDTYIPSILILPSSYLLIGKIMPCLTASMSNIWYPVAFLLKQPGLPVYSVNIFAVTIASVSLTICGIAVFVIYIAKKYQYSLNSQCLFFLITFVALVVPFVMTSAHSNHPYLATVLMIILLGMLNRNKLFVFAFNAMLILMFLATFSRYGLGQEHMQTILPHNGIISNSIAIAASITFVILLFFLVKAALFRNDDSSTTVETEKESTR